MKHYRLDRDAQADLVSIHAYIARDNLTAADSLILKLKTKFRLLASEPMLGQQRPELSPNLRAFCVGNYTIFYRPVEQGIEIARVIHAARDIDAQF